MSGWIIEEAKKSQTLLRLMISGPSGAGKTYSALLISQGLLRDKPEGKVCLIDTEKRSANLYADEFDFHTVGFDPPHSMERYIDVLKFVDKQGYDVVILDSLSHAWMGQGGALEEHDKATKSSKMKNSYMAWGEITPTYNKLINQMLDMDCHFIATVRAKSAHEMTEENGRKQVKKLGLAPVFRDGVEFEFTLALDMQLEDNLTECSKDRTRLFKGKRFTPTQETGHQLLDWFYAGVSVEDIQQSFYTEIMERIAKATTPDELLGLWQTQQTRIKGSDKFDEIKEAFGIRKQEVQGS